LDAAVKRLHAELGDPEGLEARARRVAGLLALCLQGALLLRHAEPIVADTFCATRLDGDWTPVLGTLPARSPVSALVERASLALDG
jgi:putative acyl-CoA dehydrogenase